MDRTNIISESNFAAIIAVRWVLRFVLATVVFSRDIIMVWREMWGLLSKTKLHICAKSPTFADTIYDIKKVETLL